jgi:hypothetical protein
MGFVDEDEDEDGDKDEDEDDEGEEGAICPLTGSPPSERSRPPE